MRVDTKAAGFVVLDVPLGTQMTVGGRAAGKGPDRMVDATGVRF